MESKTTGGFLHEDLAQLTITRCLKAVTPIDLGVSFVHWARWDYHDIALSCHV